MLASASVHADDETAVSLHPVESVEQDVELKEDLLDDTALVVAVHEGEPVDKEFTTGAFDEDEAVDELDAEPAKLLFINIINSVRCLLKFVKYNFLLIFDVEPRKNAEWKSVFELYTTMTFRDRLKKGMYIQYSTVQHRVS